MGHPPGAVTVPSAGLEALAPAVARITACHGAEPGELVALLRRDPRPGARHGQLGAIAWVLDAGRRSVLLVDHPVVGWSCPGGHVERGEDPAAAAARELAEETGLDLAPDASDPVTLSIEGVPADRFGPAHLHWLLGYRFTADPSRQLRAEPGRPASWFAVDDLPDRAPGDLVPLLTVLVAGTSPRAGRSPGPPRPSRRRTDRRGR